MKDWKLFEDLWQMIWKFIYELAAAFGWGIEDPNA